MRTLSRPMFNMGGPIKQGVMNGIREPKKNGGKMLLVGQHPKEFRDKSGREKHWWPLIAGIGSAAMRFGPAAYRGYKASRYMQPWSKNLGWAKRAREMFLPRKSLSAPMAKGAEKAGFGFGSFAATNPGTTFALASGVPQAGYGAAKLAKEAPGGAWSVAKRYADAVIPGDQSRWWKDKEPPAGVPLNPNLQKLLSAAAPVIKEEKKLSEAERKAFANKQREERVQKYLDLMGYDRSKKTAIADALIDASKIVGDRGSLDPKNITQELINPIIQATSKRLDKPDQIREAVGLMATKAEIEKDLSAETDALAKTKTVKQIEVLNRQLEQGFESDIRNLLLTARTPPNKAQLEQYARLTADKYGETFTKVEGEGDISGDGIYMVEGTLVRVTDGKPKRIV